MPAIYMGDTQVTGLNGASAYQVAVAHGYTGTEEEFAQIVVQDSELLTRIGLTGDTGTDSLMGKSNEILSNITNNSSIGMFGKLMNISGTHHNASYVEGETKTFNLTVPTNSYLAYITANAGPGSGYTNTLTMRINGITYSFGIRLGSTSCIGYSIAGLREISAGGSSNISTNALSLPIGYFPRINDTEIACTFNNGYTDRTMSVSLWYYKEG